MTISSLDKLYLRVAFFALCAIPALNNVHYDPQPQFWAEISAAWAIIALFIFVLFRLPQQAIPLLIIPLALFSLYLMLQPYLLISEYPGLTLVAALEMILCIFLACALCSIKTTYGISFVMRYLCYALLSGAILQSILGLIQYSGTMHYFGNLVFYDSVHPSTNIFGHFGQRNHYAHYLSWAIFGLIYLYTERKIASIPFTALVLWFSFSITIAASRSVFIYFALALLICLIYHLRQRNQSTKRLVVAMGLATLSLVTIECCYPLVQNLFHQQHVIHSGLERLSSENVTGRRAVEWTKAWLVFKANPLFGIGWNGFARQSILLQPLFPNAAANSGLFTNCHNLVLQLLAETGLVGCSIVFGGLGLIIYQMLKKEHGAQASYTSENIILFCMIATTLAHSMNEYPLWYFYFLAIFISFLSLTTPVLILHGQTLLRLSSIPLLCLIYLILGNSIIFNRLVSYNDAPDKQAQFVAQARYLQDIAEHNLLWSYYGSYTLDNYINVDESASDRLYSLATQYKLTERLAHFHPYPDTMIKEAMLLWNLGQHNAAESVVGLALSAYPTYKSSFSETLLGEKYLPLRKLVSRKHQ